MELLAAQISEFHPSVVAVALPECIEPLRARLAAGRYAQPLKILAGTEGSTEAAADPEVDFVVSASHKSASLIRRL